jgi:type III secretory pathway component EscV
MSLEIALQQNTAALAALTDAWLKLNAQAKAIDKLPASTTIVAATATVAAKTEAAAKKTSTQPGKDTQVSQAAPAAATQEAHAPAEGVTYAAARELVLKLAATNRESIKAINTKHGIAKLSALLADENDFDSVTDQNKLNAVYADLQAIEVV